MSRTIPSQRKRRTTFSERAELLRAFDCSGLSAAAFDLMLAGNYTTFCGWRQRRDEAPGLAGAPRFVEAELPRPAVPSAILTVEVGAKIRMRISGGESLAFLKASPVFKGAFGENGRFSRQAGKKLPLQRLRKITVQLLSSCQESPMGESREQPMKNLIAGWLVLAALISCSSTAFAAETKTPTAAAVLDKYVEKIGGQAALDKVKSRTIKGEIIPQGGSEGMAWTEHTQDGKKRAWSLEIPNASPMTRVVDGDKGWSKQPDGTVSDLEGDELARLKREAGFRHRMYPKGVMELSYEKAEKQGDDTLHVLKSANGGGGTDRLFFSDKTGLLVRFRSEWDSGSSTYEESFEDYRAVEGVQFPFTRKARLNDFEFTVKLKDVKQNEPIDAAIFGKPKAD